MTTLPMQYFGRGSARIIMPRAVTRSARREWVVSPSFMILVLSLAFFTLYKATFNEPLKLKRPRTIIVLPQAPAIPKPTVDEKISFFKVVKDAARKSAEPRKHELKRVLETPRPEPKKPVPPPAAMPKKLMPPKPIVPPKKILIPRVPTRVKPLALTKEPLPKKVTSIPVPIKTMPTVSKLSTPQPTVQRQPKVAAPHEQKKSALSVPLSPTPKAPVSTKRPTPRLSAAAAPPKQLTPVQAVTAPRLKEQAPMPRVNATAVAAKKSFSPLPVTGVAPNVAADSATSKRTSVLMAQAPHKSGPPPPLSQLSAPSSMASLPSAPMSSQGSSASQGRSGKAALAPTPSRLPTATPRPDTAVNEALDVNALVQIQGSTLGQSLRVLNLKEEIYRKTSHMPPTNSPYTYRIHNYQCTVVISGGHLPTATLTFEPSDAPFEVVSALERLLPRRTM